MLEELVGDRDALVDPVGLGEVFQGCPHRLSDVEAEAVGGVGGSEGFDRREVLGEFVEEVSECVSDEGFVEAARLHARLILIRRTSA